MTNKRREGRTEQESTIKGEDAEVTNDSFRKKLIEWLRNWDQDKGGTVSKDREGERRFDNPAEGSLKEVSEEARKRRRTNQLTRKRPLSWCSKMSRQWVWRNPNSKTNLITCSSWTLEPRTSSSSIFYPEKSQRQLLNSKFLSMPDSTISIAISIWQEADWAAILLGISKESVQGEKCGIWSNADCQIFVPNDLLEEKWKRVHSGRDEQ